ncbi:MAG: TetR/AcrR family transcriptional regulator [Haliea sp.]|uniref:TetR/AcrR family transcriptional regulator n=1 Tax=Haliea sp. TaxID=1932666 RepID=UPI0032EAF0BA
MNTLNSKKAAFTRNLLLDAARELAETIEVNDISFKLVSERADISQRTMFRHFTSREEFLNAFTTREYGELDLPDIPHSVEELPSYVDVLYRKLDAQPRRVMMLLSADLLPRVLSTSGKERLERMRQVLADAFPHCAEHEIIQTAANLRYVMSASSWRYYRMNFEFDLETSVSCARMIVTQALHYLRTANSN